MTITRALGLVVALSSFAFGERVSFDTRSAWQQWTHPVDAVELQATGRIQPVPVRKNIDAVRNAEHFGGGVRSVGSNARDAGLIMDGNPTTSWSPDPADGIENAYIELDLGRLVTSSEIVITFDQSAPPFEFFTILLSSGEKFFTNALVPVEGTLGYGLSKAIGFNESHELVLDPRQRTLGLDASGSDDIGSGLADGPVGEFKESSGLIRIIRIELSKFAEDAGLAEISVSTIGDNVSLGIIERGGNIEL
ncbi:MAG: discoidin domain-containing protein, partial [Gemmatimonadetes bacterium]|nr:discoidin domain-containing protein [Gemmatimonadota bacterium]